MITKIISIIKIIKISQQWFIIALLLSMIGWTGITKAQYEPVDPNFNAAAVPDAVPKVEPKSRYGNSRHYTVFGKQYQVLASAQHYSKEGIASWYGPKFNHRKTSSGEEYNMYQMTAANKELPLPTYVRVTNLDNGDEVVVKVNDRGPFVNDRLIDLSYAAAKKLEMTGPGTAHVRVTAIDPHDHKTNHFSDNQYNNRPVQAPAVANYHTEIDVELTRFVVSS